MDTNEQILPEAQEPESEFDFLRDAIKSQETIEAIEVAEEVPEKRWHTTSDGTQVEVINGRFRDPKDGKWKFAPGNQLRKIAKGTTYRGKMPEGFAGNTLSKTDWDMLGVFMENNGMEKFIDEIQKLEGRDYIAAYLGILPFVKPKIASVEVKDEKGKKHKLDNNHTITIRDMRDNSEVVVKSE